MLAEYQLQPKQVDSFSRIWFLSGSISSHSSWRMRNRLSNHIRERSRPAWVASWYSPPAFDDSLRKERTEGVMFSRKIVES